ncbi:MAG TPA: AMP-binding protein [Candidatus Acidoferrales bacterium]|nr:AMP-binding protein [Candidatus Acidoferrales bacterium]
MSTTATRVDRLTIQERVLDIAQQLLDELGSHRGMEEIRSAAHAQSVEALHLERDLGLGSLERVELIVRAGDVFHIRPPDELFAEANTIGDVIAALELQLGQSRAGGRAAEGQGGARSGATGEAHRLFAERENAATAEELALESAETLLDVLRRRARAEPGRRHLRLREDSGETREITYGALFEGVAAFARGMENLGVAAGDRVGIMLPTCVDFFHVFLGAQMAAAIPVPIYPPVRADRIEEYAARQAAILRSAEVTTIVTFGRAEKVARLVGPQVPSLKRVTTAGQIAELGSKPGQLSGARRVTGSDIAFLQYTSGSTGDPKGVTLTHANLLANLRAILAVVGMNPADRAVSWLPLYHDMGLIGAWMGPMYAGAPLSLMSPLAFLSRPERWLWAIHEHRGTVTAAPNFAYELCVRKVPEERIEGLNLSSMRYMLNGAEPVNPATLERFAGRFARYGFDRRALMPVYGLAENSVAVSFTPPMRGWRVDWLDRAALENDGRAVAVAAPASEEERAGRNGDAPGSAADSNVVGFVSAGFPIPGNEVRIVDDAGNDVAERVEGRLWFRSPSATSGYYRNATATAGLLREGGWLDSGDRAYFAEREIFITGRAKDIIIKAGRNLYPHEIEEQAAATPGVRKGCVVAFGMVDESSGTERLVVVAETAERNAARREEIAAGIRERVAAGVGMPPDDVEMVRAGAVPKTSSGKLRREATRALFREGQLHQGRPPAWLQVSRLAARSAPKRVAGLARRTVDRLYGGYFLGMVSALAMTVWAELNIIPSRPVGARISRRLNRLFFRLVGVPIEIVGEEHLEALGTRWGRPSKGGLLIVSNHASYTDAVVMLALLGAYKYRFVAKQEVTSYPFIGGIMKKLGHFSFERENREARLKQADELEEALARGESVLIFAEGTFTPAPGLRPFQLGAFKSAVASGCPVLPIALRGTRELLPDEAVLARPGQRVTLTVCPPIYPNGEGWQEILRLRDATRAAIAEHCGEPVV